MQLERLRVSDLRQPTRARAKLWILLPVCAVLVAGCGGDDDDEPATPEQAFDAPSPEKSTQASVPDLGATDSGVEGVPVPETAEKIAEEQWTVPGVSYLELVAWYKEQMPEGEDFGRWDWCDTGGGEGTSADEAVHAHIYSRGARRILAVTIANDDPAGLVIGADQSGPC